MKFPAALIPGRLQRRYKRFLADVLLEGDGAVTVHCPNTGAMLGCQQPGSRVWLSESDKTSRKYRHTWEIVEVATGALVGVNTMRSNALVAEALARGDVLAALCGYTGLRSEVSVADGRLDFMLSDHASKPDCFVEVKNVTAAVKDGVALFPDAASARATRHLQTLIAIRAAGKRAALVFCVQRADVMRVEPAASIDPAFAAALCSARAAGVEILAAGASVALDGIVLDRPLQVDAPSL